MLMRVPGIEDIANELYGLPPEQFTAARTRYEKEAKAAGDRDAAAAIHALAKPSVTAWLANQLAREHHDELQPLLELGAGLRDATRNLDGDQLRALSRQQSALVYALVQQARQLARAAGRPVSQDTARGLEDTLRAALADEQAGRLLLAGRLTDALHPSGLGSGFGDTVGAADVIPISRAKSRERRPPREEQRRLAEQDLIDAKRALADAAAAFDDAQAQAADADHAAASAQQRLEDLRQQLESASSAASDADRHRREQTNALQRAERAVRDAERRNVDAQERRDRIVEGE
jgi:chromosome segregation ATPase